MSTQEIPPKLEQLADVYPVPRLAVECSRRFRTDSFLPTSGSTQTSNQKQWLILVVAIRWKKLEQKALNFFRNSWRNFTDVLWIFHSGYHLYSSKAFWLGGGSIERRPGRRSQNHDQYEPDSVLRRYHTFFVWFLQ